MSLSKYRNVDYTDDGCTLYECLNCYKRWEARTNPEWSEWKFCPTCGCEWEGELKWDSSKPRYYPLRPSFPNSDNPFKLYGHSLHLEERGLLENEKDEEENWTAWDNLTLYPSEYKDCKPIVNFLENNTYHKRTISLFKLYKRFHELLSEHANTKIGYCWMYDKLELRIVAKIRGVDSKGYGDTIITHHFNLPIISVKKSCKQ